MEKFEIIKSNNKQIETEYRRKYLDSLTEFQELFLEILVREGNFYLLKNNCEIIGYVIVNRENTHIVEFYSIYKSIFINSDILIKICKKLEVTNIYCKSFDIILCNAVNLITQVFKIDGILFRDYKSNGYKKEKNINERVAQNSDLGKIQIINDTFFESEGEIEAYIKNNCIILFEDINKQIIGCGLYQPIAFDYNYIDIGMLVNPNCREKGYGTYIVNRLISICEINKKIPICGCAYDNIASYKTLINAGFIPGYEILDYKIK